MRKRPPRPEAQLSGLAVARTMEISPEAIRNLEQTRLLARHDGGFVAEEVLALRDRPWVDEDAMRELIPAGKVLWLQQGPFVPATGPVRQRWRPGYGWHAGLSEKDAIDSARGWWPLAESRREGLLGIVSSVSTIIVTIGVVDDPADPVEALNDNGKVKLRVSPATAKTPIGLAMLTLFEGRRIRPRWDPVAGREEQSRSSSVIP